MNVVAVMNPPPGAPPPADVTLPFVFIIAIVLVVFVVAPLWTRWRG
jgi:hypothetical protein